MSVIVLFAVSCNDDEGETAPVRLRRVVIAYVMGENSLSAAATADLDEMRRGAAEIPADCRLVIFYDNSSSTALPQIISLDSTRGETPEYEYPEDIISTDSAGMESALKRIIADNEADEYALILWSHGSGWLESEKRRTIGIDNGSNTSSNSGTEMEIPVLRHILENTGIQWRYIFYDACFMQCMEVAYEMRNVTAWSIASPAEIPGAGADYTAMMPFFFEADGFAQDIPETYFNLYQNSCGLLISSVMSSGLDNLAAATAAALSSVNDFPTDGVQAYCAYASGTGWKPEYYDIGSCINRWTGDGGYAAWSIAMERAIPYRYATDTWLTEFSSLFTAEITDREHYAGASIYVPAEGRDNDNDAWRAYDWYADVGRLMDR